MGSADIQRIERLPGDVRRIVLRVHDEGFRFDAGQYLQIVGPDQRLVPFTIASSPHRLPELELHYYPLPDSRAAATMDAVLQGPTVRFEDPDGDIAVAAPTERPLALIVAGTGAAQAHAIVEFLAREPQQARVTLRWDPLTDGPGYCDARFRARSTKCAWLDYQRLENTDAAQWIAQHGARCADADVVICGAPDFVYGVVDALHAAGIEPARVRSDVFSYAPRPVTGAAAPRSRRPGSDG